MDFICYINSSLVVLVLHYADSSPFWIWGQLRDSCTGLRTLSDCPQRVQVNAIMCDVIVLHAGAPQGCVSSPLLFSLYTNEMKMHVEDEKLFKYADGRILVGTRWKC